MSRCGYLLFPFCLLLSFAFSQTHLVNPFVGTDGHGHTFPGATVPFGMVQLSPDTRVAGWDACAGYHYSDSTLLGFSHTHLSGTGIADYGDILFLPLTGMPGAKHRVRFSHNKESASPGYYRVQLLDEHITAELTATRRVGVHRYTFPKTNQATIQIDLRHGLGPDRVIESWLEFVGENEVEGFRRSEGWAKDQHLYFVARFSKPFKRSGFLSDSVGSGRKLVGRDVRAFVQFKIASNDPVVVKVALSSVSVEGARKNLDQEMPGWDFDKIRKEAAQLWQKELGKIQVEGGTNEQKRTFYTALYHALIAPNTLSDVDGRYRAMNGEIRMAKDFKMYTVFSLWDTFRTEHPLLTIIDQKRSLDFIKSLLEKYNESGILPVWELYSNETWTMIGYHAVPVIADAYAKGIRGFDAELALRAMKSSAMQDHYGLKYYREHGFISADHENESVSKTLEYAYDDWCIAEMAGLMGKRQEREQYLERSQYYRNLFDPSTGFMRAKRNGGWAEPFDPVAVTNEYTEANAWQYSFFLPQDIPGLIELHGGKEGLEKKLDEFFFGGSAMAGRQQSDITGMIGQYAQGNEPSHHVAYLYNDVGAPWKTQMLVRRVLDSLYTDLPDGLCGNDDCGQMSAWYVMSAMGFYPVTPGKPVYSIGSPLFDKVTLQLETGKKFVMRTRNNSRKNKFIQKISLNGVPSKKLVLNHADLMAGGMIEFEMEAQPVLVWPVEDIPKPARSIVVVPVIKAPSKAFQDSLKVELVTNEKGSDVFYSVGASGRFERYSGPFFISQSCSISAFAQRENVQSKTVEASFSKWQPVGTLTLNTRYSPQYAAGGDQALLDGVWGSTDFHLGGWQGYEQTDLDAVVDLGSVKEIKSVSLRCLQDNNSWIFFPTMVSFEYSTDGRVYSQPVEVANDISPEDSQALVKEFTSGKIIETRFVRIRAKNLGVCPPWHKGRGEKAWLFADEISIVTLGESR